MDKTENSPVGRKITVEQAEACMRADSQFEIRVGAMAGGDVYIYKSGWWLHLLVGDSYFPSPFTTITERFGRSNFSPHIAADPNGTFERLFGSDRELTFEEVGAALFRGETVFGVSALGGGYLFRVAEVNGFKEVQYTNGTRDGVVHRSSAWVFGFFGPKDMEFYIVKSEEPTVEPSPKTPEERIAELEARVAELEAGR